MSASSKLRPAAVGRLVVGLLVVAGAVVALHGESRSILVSADFDRAGLNVRPGDEIRVRGVPVGTIRSIDVDRRDFSVTFKLAIDPDTRIAADTTAHLVPKTLFGDKFVELEGAAPGAPALRDGAVIPRSRTQSPVEVQQLLDKLRPVLEGIDPIELSATLASVAQGLSGAAPDLRTLVEQLPPIFDELSGREGDVAAVLQHVPGVAGTLAERSDDLAAAARDLGKVADVLAEHEPALARFITENAHLSAQAAELLTTQAPRIDRILPDSLDVLRLVSLQPGKVAALAKGLPSFVEGLAAATTTGSFRSPLSDFVVLNPGSLPDAKGSYSEAKGGSGVGPDVYVHGLESLPNPTVRVPAGSSSAGLANLLAGLTGGGR